LADLECFLFLSLFNQGDVLVVVEKDDSGWWKGQLGHETGWFPPEFVAEITEEEVQNFISSSQKGKVREHVIHIAVLCTLDNFAQLKVRKPFGTPYKRLTFSRFPPSLGAPKRNCKQK
jgi:hypothetical protein